MTLPSVCRENLPQEVAIVFPRGLQREDLTDRDAASGDVRRARPSFNNRTVQVTNVVIAQVTDRLPEIVLALGAKDLSC